MRKFITLSAVLLTAFLLSRPSIAEQKVCDPVDQESVLIKGMNESPDLFIAVLEGEKLNNFWDRMRNMGMLAGTIPYNKVYVFKSENHPNSVYVFFLADGCIGDVKLTYKPLIEQLLGD